MKLVGLETGAIATSLIGEATSPVIPYCLKVWEVAWERGAGTEAKINGEVVLSMLEKQGIADVNVSLLLTN